MTIKIRSEWIDFEAQGIKPLSSFRFSAGETNVRLSDAFDDIPSRGLTEFAIDARVTSGDDVMELLMVTDALRRKFDAPTLHLLIPYFPYSRQDRVCSAGEALGARVMCDLINSQMYDCVETWDAHSDVVPALLDNCVNFHCSNFVERVVHASPAITVLLSPDGGAAKEKVPTCAKATSCEMMEAVKHRNPHTGEITGTTVADDQIVKMLGCDRVLMVDDICDGGRTFVELAKVVRPHLTGGQTLELYVTHGIFSKGLDVFNGLIDKIHCPNIWPLVVRDPTRLIEVKYFHED